MIDLSDITKSIPKSNLYECFLAHKPWLRDKSHHYMAYIRWYTGPKREDSSYYRPWTYRRAYGPTAQDALETLLIKMRQ